MDKIPPQFSKVKVNSKVNPWRLPKILVIHLKLFDQAKRWGNKVKAYVDYPTSGLHLKSYVLSQKDESLMYNLYATTNHYEKLGGEHIAARYKGVLFKDTLSIWVKLSGTISVFRGITVFDIRASFIRVRSQKIWPSLYRAATVVTTFAQNVQNKNWYNFDDTS
ncbi:hypothetical protein CU098_005124, partial [Rhizopus stolonifer]